MAFNPDTTTMQDAKTGTIPFNESQEIITGVKTGSAYMQLAKAVPMTKPVEKFTHMSGVGAYWVDETKKIKTSKPTWLNVEMRAYKLAVIIPTTKENLNFSVTNFFEMMQPEIMEAFHKKYDAAVFAGVDSPWDKSLLSAATGAGNVVTETKNKYDDISNAMGLLEERDLVPNGIASTNKQRVKYRNSKDGNGLPLFHAPTADGVGSVAGLPVTFLPAQELHNTEIAELVGDWDNAYYGILQDINYEILTEATLTTVTDEEGNFINLAERDMVALKATMMVGSMIVKDEAFAVIKTPTETGA